MFIPQCERRSKTGREGEWGVLGEGEEKGRVGEGALALTVSGHSCNSCLLPSHPDRHRAPTILLRSQSSAAAEPFPSPALGKGKTCHLRAPTSRGLLRGRKNPAWTQNTKSPGTQMSNDGLKKKKKKNRSGSSSYLFSSN